MSDSENVSPVRMFQQGDLSISSTPISQRKMPNFNLNSSVSDLLESQLKGSPIKRLGLSETTPNVSQNLTQSPGSVPSLTEHKKLERMYADCVIRNSSLVREKERLEEEIEYKDKQILQKTSRINTLSNENKLILKELQNERALNELEFTKFRDIQSRYELEIKQLRQNPTLNKSLEAGDERTLIIQTETIEKLNKRIRILETENELEINSKKLIIDELEFFKSKLSEMEMKYESIREEYESIMEAKFMTDEYEEEIIEISEEYDLEDHHRLVSSDSHHSDISDATSTPSRYHKEAGVKSLANELEDITGIHVPKRNHSAGSTATIGSSKLSQQRMASSIRQSSFNKYLKDLEIKNLQQLHAQETMKLNFQLKSLKLQNEKLTSYIGFLLQKKHSDDRFAIYKDDLDHQRETLGTEDLDETEYEYSDKINIKLAQNNLKTVIRCASAYPIRKTNQPLLYDENDDEPENVQESYDDVLKIDENKGKTTITSTSSTSRVIQFDHQNHKMNRRYSSYGNYEQRSREASGLSQNPFNRTGTMTEPDYGMDEDKEESDYAELGDSSCPDSELESDDEDEEDDDENTGREEWYNEYVNRSMNVSITPMLSVSKRKKSRSILNQKHVPRRRIAKLTAFNSPLRANKRPSVLFHRIEEEEGEEKVNNFSNNDIHNISHDDSAYFLDNLDNLNIDHYYSAFTRCSKHKYGPCMCHFSNFSNIMNYERLFIFPIQSYFESMYTSHSTISRVSSNASGGIERVTSNSSTCNINYTYIYEKYDLKNVKGKRAISDISYDDEYDSEVDACELD